MAEMTPARKRIAIAILMVGGVLTVERVIALGTEDDSVVAPAAPRPARAPSAARASAKNDAAAVALRLDRLDGRQATLKDPGDPDQAAQYQLFNATSWAPPPPPAPPAEPPPPPVAPPFPYAYMGKLQEDGAVTVFFTQGNRVIPVKVGDTVDSVFRIDQITSDAMSLTYLPLKQTQVLALGNSP